MNELLLAGGFLFVVGNLLWLGFILSRSDNKWDRYRIYREDNSLYWAKVLVGRFWGIDIYNTFKVGGSKCMRVSKDDLKVDLEESYIKHKKKVNNLVEEK